MNAAAKAINRENVFNTHLSDLRLPKQVWLLLFLVLSVLISALVVIYTTNEYRSSFSFLQQLLEQRQELEVQRGKLVLEQASLATPARVEALAMEKLAMSLPAEHQTFVLQHKY